MNSYFYSLTMILCEARYFMWVADAENIANEENQ